MTPTPCSKKNVIQAFAQRLLLAVFLPLSEKDVADSFWDTKDTASCLRSVSFQC